MGECKVYPSNFIDTFPGSVAFLRAIFGFFAVNFANF